MTIEGQSSGCGNGRWRRVELHFVVLRFYVEKSEGKREWAGNSSGMHGSTEWLTVDRGACKQGARKDYDEEVNLHQSRTEPCRGCSPSKKEESSTDGLGGQERHRQGWQGGRSVTGKDGN
jgi:hypothetical protein